MSEEIQISITLLGVFFLGGFVGFLLGSAINWASSINLKVASAVIGAALGGAPILFMGGLAFQKWMYPIGLVVGFLWVRLVRVRASRTESKFSGTLTAILVLTGVIILCALFAFTLIWPSIREITEMLFGPNR